MILRIGYLWLLIIVGTQLNAQEERLSVSELEKIRLDSVIPLDVFLSEIEVGEIKRTLKGEWMDDIKENPYTTTTWSISNQGLVISFEEEESNGSPWYMLDMNISNQAHYLQYGPYKLSAGTSIEKVRKAFKKIYRQKDDEVIISFLDFPCSLRFKFNPNNRVEFIKFFNFN